METLEGHVRPVPLLAFNLEKGSLLPGSFVMRLTEVWQAPEGVLVVTASLSKAS